MSKKIWNKSGIPHTNWIHMDVKFVSSGSICEMCGNHLKWVHTLKHPTYPYSIHVGCICASNLEKNSQAITLEKHAKAQRIAKKRNFMQLGWKLNMKGNLIRWVDGTCATLIKSRYKENSYLLMFGSIRTEILGTQETALEVLFDLVESKSTTSK